MTETEAAVIAAAKKWLESKEAVLAADEMRQNPMETERVFDKAETKLTDAVYLLLGRTPAVPRKTT